MISGIYAIYCIPTGKYYIGSAKNFKQRWQCHLWYLENNKHYNRYLQFAWNKYWGCNFQFLIIEYCEKDQTLIREQWWLDITHCWNMEIGYNLNPKAESPLGRKWTEEQRNKKRGKKQTEESNKRRSETLKGRPFTKEHRAKLEAKKRKLEKWPCAAGAWCKCRRCLDQKNEMDRKRKEAKRNAKTTN